MDWLFHWSFLVFLVQEAPYPGVRPTAQTFGGTWDLQLPAEHRGWAGTGSKWSKVKRESSAWVAK